MVGGVQTTVNASDLLLHTWQQSVGPLSNLQKERLIAFDRPLSNAQLFMRRHSPGVALAEFHNALDLLKGLDKRMTGLDVATIKFPGVRSSQQAIEAAIDRVSVVRTAVRMLAGLPR